ncbi:hypothetical protein D3C76_451360 [compost metagenome]
MHDLRERLNLLGVGVQLSCDQLRDRGHRQWPQHDACTGQRLLAAQHLQHSPFALEGLRLRLAIRQDQHQMPGLPVDEGLQKRQRRIVCPLHVIHEQHQGASRLGEDFQYIQQGAVGALERMSGRHVRQLSCDPDDQLGLGRQFHQKPAPPLKPFDQLLAQRLQLQSRLAQQLGHQRLEDFCQGCKWNFLLQQIALAAGPVAWRQGPDTLMYQRRLSGARRATDQQDPSNAIAAHLIHQLDQLRAFGLSTKQHIAAGRGRQHIESAQAERVDTLIFQPLLLAPGQIDGH